MTIVPVPNKGKKPRYVDIYKETESMGTANESIRRKLDLNDKFICQSNRGYLGVEIISSKNLQRKLELKIINPQESLAF